MRILLVTSRYPWPPRRGDQVRAAQLVDLLAGEHPITLLAPRPAASAAAAAPPIDGLRVVAYTPASPPARGLRALAALSRGRPLQSGLYQSPDLGRRLRRLAVEHDLVVLQLARLGGHLPDAAGTPVVLDLIDSLSLNVERRLARDRPWLRPPLALEARLLARAEARLVAGARSALVVSERDRRHLAGLLPPPLAGRLAVVPLAVEAGVGPPAAATGPPVLAMTGNLGYFPNRDGVRWLLGRLWPRLAARRPGLRLLLAGDRPPRSLVRAAARVPGVEVIASPDDLAAVLRSATLALAPLWSGSGLPIKILEAWGEGVPVVASPWAAAGVVAEPGVDLRVATDVKEWEETVLGLLADPAARRRLAAAGRRRLLAEYSREAVRRRWLEALGKP